MSKDLKQMLLDYRDYEFKRLDEDPTRPLTNHYSFESFFHFVTGEHVDERPAVQKGQTE